MASEYRTQRLTTAIAGRQLPLAALDVAALGRNAEALRRRAAGTPIRIATKSVRCRWVLDNVLARQGFSGLMCYSLREAIWLVRAGARDVLLGYPTADRQALAELGADPELLAEITLMVDDVEQLRMIEATTGRAATPIRLCLDIDASLRVGPLHLGVRRSPLRTPAEAARLAGRALESGGFVPVGLMFYEAQIAGLPDSSPAVRLVKRRSAAELAGRRSAVLDAVRGTGAPIVLVNSGGTGSIEVSAADDCVTEVTAGSGLYGPALFDGYRAFRPEPALLFALPVVRRPASNIVTAFGGGYLASGPANRARLPRPVTGGLALIRAEGAGEVQTPLRGRAAGRTAIGDPVWLRHAKAGELLERFDEALLVEGSAVTGSVPSYRGEGQNFG